MAHWRTANVGSPELSGHLGRRFTPLLALQACHMAELTGTLYARIDLRLADSGAVSIIEANPNPQLSRDEDFAQSARSVGLGYQALIQRLLDLGLSWDPIRLG